MSLVRPVQVEDDQRVVIGDGGKVGSQKPPELLIVVEPPEGGPPQAELAPAGRSKVLDGRDRRIAVWRRTRVFAILFGEGASGPAQNGFGIAELFATDQGERICRRETIFEFASRRQESPQPHVIPILPSPAIRPDLDSQVTQVFAEGLEQTSRYPMYLATVSGLKGLSQ